MAGGEGEHRFQGGAPSAVGRVIARSRALGPGLRRVILDRRRRRGRRAALGGAVASSSAWACPAASPARRRLAFCGAPVAPAPGALTAPSPCSCRFLRSRFGRHAPCSSARVHAPESRCTPGPSTTRCGCENSRARGGRNHHRSGRPRLRGGWQSWPAGEGASGRGRAPPRASPEPAARAPRAAHLVLLRLGELGIRDRP